MTNLFIYVALIAIFIILSVIVTIMVHRYLNERDLRLERLEQKRNRQVNSIKDRAVYDVEINRMIFSLKKDISADKVSIERFHNGGTFNNGWDMKKFTTTHETPLGSKMPLQDVCIGVLNSRYPEAILSLVTLGEYSVFSIKDCTDLNFKNDIDKLGHKACFLFLIRQFDGTDEGFVTVAYNNEYVITKEQREIVRNSIPRILGLVNMREEHLIK